MTSDPSLVLIIDDTKASRDELARAVEEVGHTAITADSGLEGLRLLKEAQPALVLLDVEMPNIDGYKIVAAIKQQPRFVPVMLLTARTDLDSKRRAQAAGADDFVSKPVVALELQIRMAAMLRIKSLTDALDAANRRLAELADTDGLTGIANRRRFDALLTGEFERALRYLRPLSLAIVDIDHFKRVNDQHGHAVGDQALKAIAAAMAETIRQSDHVGRLGGEEFAVIAPEVGATGGFTLADRLRRRAEALRVKADSL